LNLLEAFLLGLVQGATEFLPVSSSGHLVIGQELLGLAMPGILFEVVVHLATLLSVVYVYRGRLRELALGTLVERDADAWRYLGLLLAGTAPVAFVGLVFGDHVESLFARPAAVGLALLITGTVLLTSRWALRRDLAPEFGLRIALLIGLAQCLALVPGISRSGITVVTALWLGVAPVQAAAFSFLLSIPAIGGAAVLQAPKLVEAGPGLGTLPLLCAFGVAALTGVLAIRLFVRMLAKRSFPAFAWYCWAVGILFLAWLRL
jgi:undecaprenyl-diphosphatase